MKWTEEEDKTLSKYSRYGMESLKSKLNRSRGAIIKHAQIKGVSIGKLRFSKREICYLIRARKNWVSLEDMSRYLGRSKDSIQTKLRRIAPFKIATHVEKTYPVIGYYETEADILEELELNYDSVKLKGWELNEFNKL